jgi:hypothetical protein
VQNFNNRVILNIFFRSWRGLFRARRSPVPKCDLNNFGECFDFRGWTPYPDLSEVSQQDETADEVATWEHLPLVQTETFPAGPIGWRPLDDKPCVCRCDLMDMMSEIAGRVVNVGDGPTIWPFSSARPPLSGRAYSSPLLRKAARGHLDASISCKGSKGNDRRVRREGPLAKKRTQTSLTRRVGSPEAYRDAT